MGLLDGLTGSGTGTGTASGAGGALAGLATGANPYGALISAGTDLLTFRVPQQDFILSQIQQDSEKERESSRMILIAIIIAAVAAVGLLLYFSKK